MAFLCMLHASFAQMANQGSFTKVGLDSLKKFIERNSEYKLYYVEDKSESPLVLSFWWNRSNFTDQFGSALRGAGYSLSQMKNILLVLKGDGLVAQLPDRYFSSSDQPEQDTVPYTVLLASSKNMEVNSANKIYTIGDPNVVFSGSRAMLSGYVKDVNSREPISNTSVMVASTGTVVLTDVHGFYKIPVPLGKTDLIAKGYGWEDNPIMLEVFGNGTLDIVMKEKVSSLQGIVVSADANQQRRTTYVGIEKLQISRIRHIPSVFGEADVLKVMLNLPGVKSVGESSGGFNVRGGATDQNLILFNEGTIYNPMHLFGLFSAFNPDVVSNVELYKSTIPAKYGGRLSSVLEVNSRQGNSSKITGSMGIGLLTGKFHIEGPILKERTNFIVGARTTYSNWILRLLPQSSGYRNGTASFNDVTTGFSHKVNQRNTCYLYAYYSGDRFSFSQDTIYSYQNVNLAFKWRTIFSARHHLTFTSGYDRYRHNLEEKANPVNAYDMRFGLEQYFAKANFDLLMNEKHTLSYGINAIYYQIAPGTLTPDGVLSLVIPDRVDRERAWETALFVSDKWDVTHRFSVDLGLRYTLYDAVAGSKYYHLPEFRFSSRYLVNDDLTVKAGFNTMSQNIHMLSNTVSTSPVDIWKLSDSRIVPQTGWQAAAGVYQNLFGNQWELSLEGYYKAMSHYLDYKGGSVISMNKDIASDVIETDGKAYGVELMLKKPSGKLNGWLAYSFSRTLLRESGIKDLYEINGGRWYPASYDKPHDVKLIMNYKFTHRYSFSANLDYATGRPVTIPISKYFYEGGYRLEYSNRNQYRIPDYFRLDFAFNIEPSHNLRLWTYSVITFGVYNVTGRKNAFSVYYKTTETNRVQGYKLSVFGAPIPYVNYTLKF